MRTLTTLLATLAIFATLAYGREQIWRLAFGPADLGAVDFETLERSARSNDALACPSDFCRRAAPDIVPPVYAVPAGALRTALHSAVSLEPRIDRVAKSDAAGTDRYVQRSALLRFPDTISVRTLPLGPERSTLALYSRSQIGYSDLGANKARLEHWLGLLATLPKAR